MVAGKVKADVSEATLAAVTCEPSRADAALGQALLPLGGDTGRTVQAATACATRHWGAVAARLTGKTCAGELLLPQAGSAIPTVLVTQWCQHVAVFASESTITDALAHSGFIDMAHTMLAVVVIALAAAGVLLRAP